MDRARLVSLTGGRPKRLVWIVNHRTLMEGEVPVLRGLGYEIFVPKVIPSDDPEYRSGAVTYEYDETLTLPLAALAVLNEHDFYRRVWSPTLATILNRYFDVVVTSVSLYTTPLEQAVRRFQGTVVARVFLYPSTEPRHVHYSPLEAMVVGTPVLYRRGGLIDLLAGRGALPGSCASAEEMHDKAAALLAGDRTLADEIRAKQPHVLCHFSDDLASRQWASALATADGA